MLTKILLLAIALLMVHSTDDHAWACTTFVLNHGGQQIYGSNHDWFLDDGLVMVNKRGCTKRAGRRTDENGTPAFWKAKYGSITFNQYGRDKPQGGMNEAGLVIEGNALRATDYPEPDHRPYLGTSQEWRQYILDTCATVNEVIATNKNVRISPQSRGLHALVLDKSGASAVIEFLDGRMKVYRDKDLPVKVTSNGTYAQSLQYLKEGAPPPFENWYSFTRFITASKKVNSCQAKSTKAMVADGFEALEAVSMAITQWSIVYDNANMGIYFRTKGNGEIRYLHFSKFDFSSRTPVKILDINAPLSGDATNKFSDYSYAANRDLIGRSFSKTKGLSAIPDSVLDELARLPELFDCR